MKKIIIDTIAIPYKKPKEKLKYSLRNFRIRDFFKALKKETKKNTVLVFEYNYSHGVTIPGIVKHFIDLGYNIDVILRKKGAKMKPLSIYSHPKIKLLSINSGYKLFFKNKKYDYIFINSKRIYMKEHISIEKVYPILNKLNNVIYLEHDVTNLNNKKHKNIVCLKEFEKHKKLNVKEVNTCYFGDVKITDKNKITKFIIVGSISDKRRNMNLLTDAIDFLLKENITNFEIDLIGKVEKNSKLPNFDKYEKYINYKGSVDYPEMYKNIEKSDYFLMLLDPLNKQHLKYTTDKTSGNFLLVFGFLKPCILEKTFAKPYKFNNKNSIVYDENNNLGKVMKKAITTNNKDYKETQKNLKIKADKINEKSLNNLRTVLKNLK